MNMQSMDDDMPVELVSDLNEGRVAYIAAMAPQLQKMAADAGEERLTGLLGDSAQEAVAAVARMHMRSATATLE